MSVCGVCGRQVEESYPGSGQPMPCKCISKVLPSLELEDDEPDYPEHEECER